MQNYKTFQIIWYQDWKFLILFYIFIAYLASDAHRISYFLFNIWNSGHVKTYKESHFNSDKVHSFHLEYLAKNYQVSVFDFSMFFLKQKLQHS